jgi:thioredoxin-like negative regulator of GroEL
MGGFAPAFAGKPTYTFVRMTVSTKTRSTRADAVPLLVFFCSRRSGPARRMESVLAHIARKERGRLRVGRVDVDDLPEVAARFGIETVPTLVLIKDKRAIERLEGRVSAPRIEQMLEPHLGRATALAAA